jgi:hypothetical protein
MSRNNPEEKEYTDDIVNLVIARLEGFPPDVSIIGGSDNLQQEDQKIEKLIEHVRARDEVGKKMMDVQLAYIRSFKSPQEHALSSN